MAEILRQAKGNRIVTVFDQGENKRSYHRKNNHRFLIRQKELVSPNGFTLTYKSFKIEQEALDAASKWLNQAKGVEDAATNTR